MAMIQCHYEINVSKLVGEFALTAERRYQHLFATAERSCVTERQMQDLYREIASRFPWPQYHVQVTEVECKGREVVAPLPGEGRQLPEVE